jgi:hypothetical protein
MNKPEPGDAHKKLSALIGDWSGGETLHPSPWDAGGTAAASVTNSWVLDGLAVVQQYEQRRDGQVTFRGHGVFWYDPSSQEYVMHWWDSMNGTAGEYRGDFDGDVLVLGAPMPQGGHSRTSWRLTGPDAHDFLMEVSPDGETWQPAMEGRYRKTAPARKAAGKRRVPARAKTVAKKTARPEAKAARNAATRAVTRKTAKKGTTAAKKAAKKAPKTAAKKAANTRGKKTPTKTAKPAGASRRR